MKQLESEQQFEFKTSVLQYLNSLQAGVQIVE